MIRVSLHAAQRFGERVYPCSIDEARAAILSHRRALESAVDFGCEAVRLGDGARLILDGDCVVTVYERGFIPPQCRNPFRQCGEA